MSQTSSDPEILIRVENVSKKFCRSLKKSLWYGVTDVASALNPFSSSSEEPQGTKHKAQGTNNIPLRPDEFWAVQDVSFELKRGECLGLIGHNGAGKSTLLKVLNGLIPPDTGRITMHGRVCALIELNAGFNPILSGRENIFNQAALLGFSKEETMAKFDEIVEFSEIGEFIDMPVQNYSSGMKVRLGFAVASQMEPDVLIIDEVLAVGDVGFRAKCMNRIAEILKSSACIFVSHSMPQVARVCSHVIHLDQGKVILSTDNLSAGIQSYYRMFKLGEAQSSGTGDVEIHQVLQVPNRKSGSNAVSHGGDLTLHIKGAMKNGIHSGTVQLVIWNQEMLPVIDVLGSGLKRHQIQASQDSMFDIEVTCRNLQLNAGRFSVSVIALSTDGKIMYCRLDHGIEFEMISNLGSACHFSIEGNWTNAR